MDSDGDDNDDDADDDDAGPVFVVYEKNARDR
jgi:hypothetical protein